MKIIRTSTLYLVKNTLPFCTIKVLDLKRVLKTKKAITSSMECDASHANFRFLVDRERLTDVIRYPKALGGFGFHRSSKL